MSVEAVCLLENDELASGSGDRTIKIWNLNTGKLVRTIQGHESSVGALVALKNGKFASGSFDHNIKVWKNL